MGLIANAHQQKQRGRIPRQHDRILSIGQEYALLGLHHRTRARVIEHVLLGERDHVNLIEQLELSQNFKCYIELTFTAVDDPEIGIFALRDRSLQRRLSTSYMLAKSSWPVNARIR